jgi:hypothetical protein
MKCKISCSFGEVVDKMTILKIKLKKATDEEALRNIKNELDSILFETPLVSCDDDLFDELYYVNNRLWVLEDLIRAKSKNKSFDEEYISYAEDIHVTNDKRYRIKREINEKYDSELKEEKVYANNKVIKSEENNSTNILTNINLNDNFNIVVDDNIVTQNDMMLLQKGKEYYRHGNFNESLHILRSLMNKYNDYNKYDNFYVELIFSYNNILNIFSLRNEHADKIQDIMKKLNILNILKALKEFCKSQYILYCFENLKYEDSFDYINYYNSITGPNVHMNNMSFFQENDVNKTLLLYDGGGLGDKFMFLRFVPQLCEKYKNNNIIFFTNDNICWFVKELFTFENLFIVGYSMPALLGKFDYHCSLVYLMKEFNITYDSLIFTPLLKKLNSLITNKNSGIIQEIQESNKKTFIFNWKGNSKNMHEKHNRSMQLIEAIPLFKIKKHNFVIITKEINAEEMEIINKYDNVKYIGNVIDNGDNCFEDSTEIIRNVDGVISTDTSIVHISLNLNVPTYVMLTKGCEWRWKTRENINTTNWYPDAKLFKQTKQGLWSTVINEIISVID